MSESMHLEGLDEAAAALRKLGNKDAKKVVRKGLRVGGKIVKKAVKAEAPVRKGIMRKSISARAVRKTPGKIAVRVSPRKAGWYARFVVAGHKTASGTVTKPNDFVQRGFDASKGPAAEAVAQVVSDGLKQAFNSTF